VRRGKSGQNRGTIPPRDILPHFGYRQREVRSEPNCGARNPMSEAVSRTSHSEGQRLESTCKIQDSKFKITPSPNGPMTRLRDHPMAQRPDRPITRFSDSPSTCGGIPVSIIPKNGERSKHETMVEKNRMGNPRRLLPGGGIRLRATGALRRKTLRFDRMERGEGHLWRGLLSGGLAREPMGERRDHDAGGRNQLCPNGRIRLGKDGTGGKPF